MKEWLIASWLGIGFGIFVGWLILPQPQWIQSIHSNIISWIKSKIGLGS